MGAPLLIDFFSSLPEEAIRETPDLPSGRIGEQEDSKRKPAVGGKARRRAAIHVFTRQVQERYTEGTLLRLLQMGDVQSRRAAVFALGLIGTQAATEPLAVCLHDDDDDVARLAADALWAVWFRGDSSAHSDELYRLARARDIEKALNGLHDLIGRAPNFAEAYNQRAIVYFRMEQFERAAADCEMALKLNPQHFGAQAGLGQCYWKLRKHLAALRAFKIALRINPRLRGIAEAVRSLENMLGDVSEQ